MPAFQSHPSAFRLPRYTAPDVEISPPDARVDAAFAVLAQSQGFQHYGRLDSEYLTQLFMALVQARGDETVKARALNTLFGGDYHSGWEQYFGTTFIRASDETVGKICHILKDNGRLRDARTRVLSAQAKLQVPPIDTSP